VGGLIIALGVTFVAPASAQSPAEAVAAAKELIVVIKIDEQFKTIMPIIMQQLKPMIVQQRPQVERDFDAIMPDLLQVANARAGELSDLIAPLYPRHFTAGELHEMAAFYRSPTGQKALQK